MLWRRVVVSRALTRLGPGTRDIKVTDVVQVGAQLSILFDDVKAGGNQLNPYNPQASKRERGCGCIHYIYCCIKNNVVQVV